MKKKVNKILAVFILISMIMSSVPFNIFAIENQEDYTQFQLNGATGVETDSKTVYYENGTMTVDDQNAILVNNDGACFLYTQLENLTVHFSPNENSHIDAVYIDGYRENLTDNSYTITGLTKGSNVNIDPEFVAQDVFVERAEIELRGAIGINEDTNTINYDGASITVAGEDLEFKSEQGIDKETQMPVTVYFLITSGDSLTFTLNGEYEETPTLLFNGARENFAGNQYILEGLNPQSRIIFELDLGNGNNGGENPQPNDDSIQIEFDNAIIEGNVLTFNVNGKEITAEVIGAEISDGRIELDRNDLYNVRFSLSDNYDNEEMQVIVRGENQYQGILPINGDNEATFDGLIVGRWLHFTIEPKAGGENPQPQIEVDAPELEEDYIVLSMESEEHTRGTILYYFVDANGYYLDKDGNVINEQKQPAGEINTGDEIQKVAIPESTEKVLLGLEEHNATSAGPVVLYTNNDHMNLNKDEMKYGRTIEIPYAKGDKIGLSVAWFFWHGEEEFYPEEKGTYLIANFMNNEDAIIKYKDVNGEEQILDISKDMQAVEISRNPSITVPEELGSEHRVVGDVHIDVYDENMDLIEGPEGDIFELLRYGDGDFDSYFDTWVGGLNNETYSTLDLSGLNENYTYVVNVNLIDPTNEYQAHVLTWTNMRGSGWGDDALIDGGFARLVKAYDKEGNLIYDADVEYSEENYFFDEVRGERTNKFVYGEPMEYFWERGPMYEFAVTQEEDGGEIEAVEGTKLVMEFTPVYGKQLVNVSLGESDGNAEGTARYYTLTMPANHVHFNAQFEDINNEALIAQDTSVASMGYILDKDALDSGTAVLTLDNAYDLSEEQRESFEEIAGPDYEVTDYLDLSLKQVWFKGVNAEFDNELGYSDEDVWSKDVYDLGDKNATITIQLDEGVSPDDVIILHELHNEEEIIGYESVNITEKNKDQDGIWTVTFETSKFSNYAIASKLDDTTEKYTVSFETFGGTEIGAQEVRSGENAYWPEQTPVKEGYVFEGWYEDELGTVEFEFWNTPITKDTTVYAKWVEIQGEITNLDFTIKAPQVGDTIELDEWGTPSDAPNITINSINTSYLWGTAWIKGTYQEIGDEYEELFEGTFEEDTYYYAGVEFEVGDGYILSPDLQITVNGEAPAEVFAIYNQTTTRFIAKIKSQSKLPEYTVSFDTNGGSEVEAQQVEQGDYAYYPNITPTKEGYVFDGWYEDELGTVYFEFWNTPITKDTTVYAKWVEIQGSVKEINVTVKAPQIGNSGIQPPNTRDGGNDYYSYGRLWTSELVDEEEMELGYAYDKQVTGNFEKDTYYYAVITSYAPESGYVIDPDVKILVNGEEPVAVFSIEDQTHITYVAKLKSIEKLPDYTVTFDVGEGPEVEPQLVEKDEYAEYPYQGEWKDHIFYGWYEDSACTVEFEFWDTPITKDTTVYGKWVEKLGEIGDLAVNVEAPKAGGVVEVNNVDLGGYGYIEQSNTPVATVANNVHYSVGETMWVIADEDNEITDYFEGTFEEGKTYTAAILLEADEGYVLSEGNRQITVNGDQEGRVYPLISEMYIVVLADVKAVAQGQEEPVHVHNIEAVEAVAPTCEKDGNSAYYKCTECGKYFEDAMGTIEIADIATMKIAALGHDWNEWVVTKEPSVTETGLKVRTCKNDPTHIEREELARIAVKVESEETVAEVSETGKVASAASEVINAAMAGEETVGISDELKAEIIEAANNGKTVKVDLAVEEVDEAAIAEDVEKVEEILPETAEVAQYFDIDVLLKVDGEVKGNITELDSNIKIALPIPEDLPEVKDGYTRIFTVIRVHEGVATPLKTNVKGDNIEFSTNLFSTYALTYQDVVTPTSNPNTSSNPITSDPIMLYVIAFGISLVAISGITYSKKFKKSQN